MHRTPREEARSRIWRVAPVVAAILAVCCAHSDVAPAAEPAATPLPIFHLIPINGGPVGFLYGLSVISCDGATVYWSMGTSGGPSVPDTIVYGVLPKGYVGQVEPRPLVPGCYRAYLSDVKPVQFRVQADGRVVNEGPVGSVTQAP